MRILLLTHRFPPDGVGGVERYVENLAGALAEQGETVAVLTRTPRRFPRRPQVRRDSRIRPYDVVRIVGSGVRLEQFLVGAARTERLFSEAAAWFQPDVVHVHHLIGLSPRIVPAARELGAAVVWSLHDHYVECPLVHLVKVTGEPCAGPRGGEECEQTCFARERRPERWRTRYAYFAEVAATADVVLAPSDRLASVARTMAPAARVEILPLAVRSAGRRERRASRSTGQLAVAFIGNIAPHKGIDVLLAALAERAAPAVRLTVAGRVDDERVRSRILAAAAALPHVDLDWRGEYEPEELAAILDAVDVVAAPSLVAEGYPLVPREALAAGIPVIASRVSGLEEALAEGENGLLVPAGDAAALAGALRRLADEPGLLERLRDGAAAGGRGPSLDEHAEQLRAVYRSAAAHRAGRPRDRLDALHAQLLAQGFGRR